MRVALVGPTAPLRGGIVAHTACAREVLARRGHAVDVVPVVNVFPRWIARGRPRVEPGSIPRGAIDALSPRSWAAAAAAISTDVLIVEHWTPLLAPALRVILSRARARRRVLVCHNVEPHERVPGARMLTRALTGRSDTVIFHSRYVARLGHALDPTLTARSTVIPLPLLMPPGVESRVPPELDGVIDRNAGLVALVGHLREYKGLASLVRAWRSVAEARSVRLVVAGEPLGVSRDLGRLERLAALGFPVTLIRRYLDDGELAWLLSNARVVALPYASASQSGVLPLAMRFAHRVVVSDAGALPEQLGEKGADPTVFSAGDPASLAQALSGALVRSREPRRRAMRQDAEAGGYAAEFMASWVRFALAVEAAGADSTTAGSASNSAARAASLHQEPADGEPSRQPWYHARRFALPGLKALQK
jgi:glycosyltransferase involved in cell wall biosynthesis